MNTARYEHPAPATVDDVLARVARGDSAAAASALVGATLGARVDDALDDVAMSTHHTRNP